MCFHPLLHTGPLQKNSVTNDLVTPNSPCSVGSRSLSWNVYVPSKERRAVFLFDHGSQRYVFPAPGYGIVQG
jgi:hypothetical protein